MLVGQETTEADLADREITVMGDKSLPYDVLKKVMRTCTDADYGRISLAVLQKDKPVPPARALGHSCMQLTPYYRELRTGLGGRSGGTAVDSAACWAAACCCCCCSASCCP